MKMRIMHTLNLNQADINNLFQTKIAEPVLLKNNFGTEYLILPFSRENWQDVFLMLYKSFSDKEQTDKDVLIEKRLTAIEFGKKWTGILAATQETDIHNVYHNHLTEKYL